MILWQSMKLYPATYKGQQNWAENNVRTPWPLCTRQWMPSAPSILGSPSNATQRYDLLRKCCVLHFVPHDFPHLLLLWSKNQNVRTRDKQKEGSKSAVECPVALGSVLPAGQRASIISPWGVHAPISLSTAECQGCVEHNLGIITMSTRDPGFFF